jgi:3-oxoadipate enol-lactonase
MRTTVNTDACPVAWRESGSGPLALFLHGLGGSRTSWDAQLATLGAFRRCVAWDMPGYGASAGSPSSFEELADAAADLVLTLADGASEAVDVVGLSMGGMIAQHLALRHPHLVRSLVLLDTSPAFGLDGSRPDEWLRQRLAPLAAGISPAAMAPQVLTSIAGPALTDDRLADAVAAMGRIDGDALATACRTLVTHDTRDRLATITCPTLVAVGELDDETPAAYSRVLHEAIPGSRLVVLPGVGHLANIEAPAAVNDLIAALWAETREEVHVD